MLGKSNGFGCGWWGVGGSKLGGGGGGGGKETTVNWGAERMERMMGVGEGGWYQSGVDDKRSRGKRPVSQHQSLAHAWPAKSRMQMNA